MIVVACRPVSFWLPKEGEKRRRIEGANYARRAAEKASKKAARIGVGLGWVDLASGIYWKINMEPQNEGLVQMIFPVQTGDFQVPC